MLTRLRRVLVFVLALAGATSAQAQRVRGVVRDSATASPVIGAVLWLSDSSGASVARTITDAAGAFSVVRPRTAVRAHVVRIGYRPADLALVAADAPLEVRLPPIPPMLLGMIATSAVSCPGDKRNTEGLALWDQAHAALLASVVAREAQPPRIRLISREKTLEPIRRKVTNTVTSIKELVVDRSYVAARSAPAFSVFGYMLEDGAERVFYAPDNETLLDPSFTDTHCLRTIGGDREHPDQVGISFEPVGGGGRDTIVDVRGILWIDRAVPALRSLEFRYTGLEPEARESGGTVVFHSMPNGASIVRQWTINTAAITLPTPRSEVVHRLPPRDMRTNARVTAYHEYSGEVASLQWPDGTSWHAALPRITGILMDTAGMPIAGARVWMYKTADTVSTDSAGHFALPYVPAGAYAVLAADTVMAKAGLSRTAHYWVMLDGTAEVSIRIAAQPRSFLLRQLCGEQGYAEGTGVVLGQVLTAQGEPASGARIEVWRRFTKQNVELFRQDPGGMAGTDGRFVICGTPLSLQLKLRATFDEDTAETGVKWGDDVFFAHLVVKSHP